MDITEQLAEGRRMHKMINAAIIELANKIDEEMDASLRHLIVDRGIEEYAAFRILSDDLGNIADGMQNLLRSELQDAVTRRRRGLSL